MAVDKVEQLTLRLNKQLISEIASLCEVEVEINAREAAAAATASGAVGASNSSIAPTETATSSGPLSVEVVDLSYARVADRIAKHEQVPNWQTLGT